MVRTRGVPTIASRPNLSGEKSLTTFLNCCQRPVYLFRLIKMTIDCCVTTLDLFWGEYVFNKRGSLSGQIDNVRLRSSYAKPPLSIFRVKGIEQDISEEPWLNLPRKSNRLPPIEHPAQPVAAWQVAQMCRDVAERCVEYPSIAIGFYHAIGCCLSDHSADARIWR